MECPQRLQSSSGKWEQSQGLSWQRFRDSRTRTLKGRSEDCSVPRLPSARQPSVFLLIKQPSLAALPFSSALVTLVMPGILTPTPNMVPSVHEARHLLCRGAATPCSGSFLQHSENILCTGHGPHSGAVDLAEEARTSPCWWDRKK